MPERYPSPLFESLVAGRFAVTAEIAPPRGTSVEESLALADRLAPLVDAFNITDNQNARLRLSPLAFCRLMADRGHQTVYQLTCRDRNRLALQSDLLGAWSLGVRNVLALTGDHVASGDHPDAVPVFDLDSIQLLAAIRALSAGLDLAGKKLKGAPAFFPGAALACDQKPPALALLRFRKKVEAGARFFQTQAIFEPSSLEPFLKAAGGDQPVFILAGILLLHSRSMIDYINRKVPGLKVPPEVATRVGDAKDTFDAGLDEAAELIRRVRPLCHGIHLMTAGRDDLLPELLKRSGLR